MTSKTVTQLLADLGVLQSHSRPHQSNDNPFSEAQVQDPEVLPHASPSASPASTTPARFVDAFFDHYNHQHRHSGIGLHTPADVHHGRAQPSAPDDKPSSTPPTPPTPSDSADHPARPASPTQHGSTDPRRRP